MCHYCGRKRIPRSLRHHDLQLATDVSKDARIDAATDRGNKTTVMTDTIKRSEYEVRTVRKFSLYIYNAVIWLIH